VRAPRVKALLRAAGLGFAALVMLDACTVVGVGHGPVLTPAAARAAVIHHWDINRQALRATSAGRARRLIEEVEKGDALRMDEAIIAREADARGADPAPAPPIADASDVRVFVPRQDTYPASFLSIRTQEQATPRGVLTGKKIQVLEIFRRESSGDNWRNTGYAAVGDGLLGKLDISLDRDGYAAFATGSPGGGELSVMYTDYLTELVAGKPVPTGHRIQPGPLTDQFATQLQHALASTPSVTGTVTFSPSKRQEGIKLKLSDGGSFVIFANLYDLVTSPSGGGCVTAGPGSATPGSFSSVTDHFLQNVGAVVAPGAAGPVSVIAESDSPFATDSKPCASGTTV
jgi:hypothetical protein